MSNKLHLHVNQENQLSINKKKDETVASLVGTFLIDLIVSRNEVINS